MDNPFTDTENAERFAVLSEKLLEKLKSGDITLVHLDGFLRSESHEREELCNSHMNTIIYHDHADICIPEDFRPQPIGELNYELYKGLSFQGGIQVNESRLVPGTNYDLYRYHIREDTPKDYLITYFRRIGWHSFGIQGLLFLYDMYRSFFDKNEQYSFCLDDYCFFNDGVIFHIAVNVDAVKIAHQNCEAGVVKKGTKFLVFKYNG